MKARFLSGVVMTFCFFAVAGFAQVSTPHPYLALGDSVAYGYVTSAGYEYVNPTNFVSYSEDLSANFHLTPVNLACPGEASGSFMSTSAPDHGCRQFRGYFPLHVPYNGSQLDKAVTFLRAHPETRLVTIQLGANDGFMLEDYCATQADYVTCMETSLPSLLASVGANVGQIIGTLRAAGFHGIIIVVNYYSTDYTDALNTTFTAYLNSTLATVAHATGSYVADVFTAFQTASSTPFAQGKTCVAGLLNVNPVDNTTCDVHPTQSGHRLMADVISRTYTAALASH